MKKFIALIILVLVTAVTGTPAQAWQFPWNRKKAAAAAGRANAPADSTAGDGLTSQASAASAAIDPEQDRLMRLQDKLNVFASPRYLADVAAAKAAGSDSVQNQCMNATVEIGADLKAKPLIAVPSIDTGAVDRSCGWCILAAKRKAAAELKSGPSLLTRLADARARVLALARKGLVSCAPLREDERLSVLSPEDAAAALLTLFEHVAGEVQNR